MWMSYQVVVTIAWNFDVDVLAVGHAAIGVNEVLNAPVLQSHTGVVGLGNLPGPKLHWQR